MARKKLTVHRKAYTRKDGTRVKACTYKVEDRGKRGRGPNKIKLREGGLGGEGYLDRSDLGRRRALGQSMRKDGYATTMRRITALLNLGSRTMSDADKRKLRRDQRWLREHKPKS